MARYIDGFVVPLRHDQVDEYERVAKGASEIYLEHGALEYHECLGDDLQVHCGRSFTDLADLSEAEAYARLVEADLGEERLALPILKRGQKGVADKGVCAAGNGIPLCGGNAVYRGCKIKGKGIAIHA